MSLAQGAQGDPKAVTLENLNGSAPAPGVPVPMLVLPDVLKKKTVPAPTLIIVPLQEFRNALVPPLSEIIPSYEYLEEMLNGKFDAKN